MSDKVPPATFREALVFWWKLGWISFGGPAGQIATMHREVVEERRWISESRFLHALNYCMVLPGPEAQQLATYLGWLMHRTLGGVVAGVLFVLPSLFILLGLAALYVTYGSVPWVSALFAGTKPVVVAILLQAMMKIGRRTLTHLVTWVIGLLALLAIQLWNVPFPAVVLAAALVGWWIGRVRPAWLRSEVRQEAGVSSHSRAWIDDDTPLPAHACWSAPRALKIILICVLLWLVPMGLCWALGGLQHPMTQMGWFFSKVALFTIGGAYAILPYVESSAVDRFSWLSRSQMMDGFALGESTPGPLIMVLTFVGFLGGWNSGWLGQDHLLMAGVLCGLIVTWFTFLPSFLFILLGAPLIEMTRGNKDFHYPLMAVAAVSTAVIARLAWRFGDHAFRSKGEFDLFAICLAVLAWWALVKLKVPVVWAVLAGGLAGVVRALFF